MTWWLAAHRYQTVRRLPTTVKVASAASIAPAMEASLGASYPFSSQEDDGGLKHGQPDTGLRPPGTAAGPATALSFRCSALQTRIWMMAVHKGQYTPVSPRVQEFLAPKRGKLAYT